MLWNWLYFPYAHQSQNQICKDTKLSNVEDHIHVSIKHILEKTFHFLSLIINFAPHVGLLFGNPKLLAYTLSGVFENEYGLDSGANVNNYGWPITVIKTHMIKNILRLAVPQDQAKSWHWQG